MNMPYFAIRPVAIPNHVRIEKAETPERAADLAFGRGPYDERWEYKDLGTVARVLQSDRKRVAMLQDPAGWIAFAKRHG